MAEKTEVQNKTVQYSMERLETEEGADEDDGKNPGNIELAIMDLDFDIEVIRVFFIYLLIFICMN